MPHNRGCNRNHDPDADPCSRTHDAGCHGWHDESRPCFERHAPPSAEIARRVASRHDLVQQLRDKRRQTWLVMAALVGNVDGRGALTVEEMAQWDILELQLAHFDARLASLLGHASMVDVTAVGDHERVYIPGGPMAPSNLTGTSAGIGYVGARDAPGWTAAELAAADAGEFVASTVIAGPCADCGTDDEPVDSDRRCYYCAALRKLPTRPARPRKPARRHRARQTLRRASILALAASLLTAVIPGLATVSAGLVVGGFFGLLVCLVTACL